VLVRNPMNFRQVSRVKIMPDTIDGVVFWTKNPWPMVERINELHEYMYYFQFTITPYGKDVEPNLPQKNTTYVLLKKLRRNYIITGRVVKIYRGV